MLHHYVFIKYAKDTGEDHIAEFCRRMLALRASIDDIGYLEIGRDVLREGRSWDLVLIMRFQSVEALRRYQRHPEHQAVMAYNQPRVAEVGTVDFTEPLT
ncbi:MAG TPA: Dabb family protein [Candidatus Acidoferrum sp.]|nr:Dabb family protein [Candidatus Acidoferrum sp.]